MEPSTYQSLLILKRISLQMINAKAAMEHIVIRKTIERGEEWNNLTISLLDTSLYSLIFYSLVNYCAFLDEYTKYFTKSLEKDEKKLKQVVKRVEPFVKELESVFGNIKTVRNRVLAHGFRDHLHAPLSNTQINQLFNQVMKTDIEPYYQLSINTTGMVAAIEDIVGKIREEDIDLIDEEL